MKTLRVTQTFDPAKLHSELQGAGFSVVTVRASSPDAGSPAFYGVVVFEGQTDLKKAEIVIKAHKETRKLSRQPDAKQMESALQAMEKV